MAQSTLLAGICSLTPDENLTKFFASPCGVEKIHLEILALLSMCNMLNICKIDYSQHLWQQVEFNLFYFLLQVLSVVSPHSLVVSLTWFAHT